MTSQWIGLFRSSLERAKLVLAVSVLDLDVVGKPDRSTVTRNQSLWRYISNGNTLNVSLMCDTKDEIVGVRFEWSDIREQTKKDNTFKFRTREKQNMIYGPESLKLAYGCHLEAGSDCPGCNDELVDYYTYRFQTLVVLKNSLQS